MSGGPNNLSVNDSGDILLISPEDALTVSIESASSYLKINGLGDVLLVSGAGRLLTEAATPSEDYIFESGTYSVSGSNNVWDDGETIWDGGATSWDYSTPEKIYITRNVWTNSEEYSIDFSGTIDLSKFTYIHSGYYTLEESSLSVERTIPLPSSEYSFVQGSVDVSKATIVFPAEFDLTPSNIALDRSLTVNSDLIYGFEYSEITVFRGKEYVITPGDYELANSTLTLDYSYVYDSVEYVITPSEVEVAKIRFVTLEPTAYKFTENNVGITANRIFQTTEYKTELSEVKFRRVLNGLPGKYSAKGSRIGIDRDLIVYPNWLTYFGRRQVIHRRLVHLPEQYRTEWNGFTNDRTTLVRPSKYLLQDKKIRININTIVYPDEYLYETSPVYTHKNNVFLLYPASYEFTESDLEIKAYMDGEGNYIKDSGNHYMMYPDEAADYFITVDTEKLGIYDNTNYEFTGEFGKHPTSPTKFPITVEKIDTQTIKLSIPNEISTDLYGRYLFDIFVTVPNGKVRRLINGDIIFSESVTR